MIRQKRGDCVVLPALIVGKPGGAWIKSDTQLLLSSIRLRFRWYELKVQRWRYVVSGVCSRPYLFIYLIPLFVCMLKYFIMPLLILDSTNSFRTQFNSCCRLLFLVFCCKARFLGVILAGSWAFVACRILERRFCRVTLEEHIGLTFAERAEMDATRSRKFNNLLHHVIGMLADSRICIMSWARCL